MVEYITNLKHHQAVPVKLPRKTVVIGSKTIDSSKQKIKSNCNTGIRGININKLQLFVLDNKMWVHLCLSNRYILQISV